MNRFKKEQEKLIFQNKNDKKRGEWRRKTFVNQNKNKNIEGDKNGLALWGTYMVDRKILSC